MSPYASMVRGLRCIFKQQGVETFRDRGGVEIASVDAYQGREKQVIVMCTVRPCKTRTHSKLK